VKRDRERERERREFDEFFTIIGRVQKRKTKKKRKERD